jgi:CheY-like chemotaxis protein
MSTESLEDRLPSEVKDSVTFNQLQVHRAIQTLGDATAETPIGTASGLRVLVVDYDRDAADTLSMLVGAWGHDVRRAYEGIRGLALAAAFQPDVLLIDIAMPNMSGLELALKVRHHACLNDCFMIAVTRCIDAKYRLQCEEAGIDLFLIKPVQLSIVQSLLLLESDYVLRTREDRNSHRSTQLPYHVLQETIVS